MASAERIGQNRAGSASRKCEQSAGGLHFDWSFDSGNLDRVAVRSAEKIGDLYAGTSQAGEPIPNGPENFEHDLSLWIRADCQGKPWQRNYTTWFYFSVSGWRPGVRVRFRIENMNRQGRLLRMGFSPLFRIGDTGPWERIPPSNLTYIQPKDHMKLEFWWVAPSESNCERVYFALTYPYSYTDLQQDLSSIDQSFSGRKIGENKDADEVYYHRMSVCRSCLGLDLDLITISSMGGMGGEERLPPLPLPPHSIPPTSFPLKPIVFISARVHPGETGASYVMKGLINYLCYSESAEAKELRSKVVFKLVPMLNPDGVQQGYYRCDTNGINLNRIYNRADRKMFPTISTVKNLVLWYASKQHLPPRPNSVQAAKEEKRAINIAETTEGISEEISHLDPSLHASVHDLRTTTPSSAKSTSALRATLPGVRKEWKASGTSSAESTPQRSFSRVSASPSAFSRTTAASASRVRENLMQRNSFQTHLPHSAQIRGKGVGGEKGKSDVGVAFYIDLHGHVSKPGCFMYGNHFAEDWKQTENWVFARLLSQRAQPYFDLSGCVFSEKNMRQKERRSSAEGRGEQGKDGAGRVSIHSATGLLHSYTIECNYHGGQYPKESKGGSPGESFVFTPEIYEKIGAAVGLSILDYLKSSALEAPTGAPFSQEHRVRTPSSRLARSSSYNPSPSLPPSPFFKSVRQWARETVQMQRSKSSVIAKPGSGQKLAESIRVTKRRKAKADNNNGAKERSQKKGQSSGKQTKGLESVQEEPKNASQSRPGSKKPPVVVSRTTNSKSFTASFRKSSSGLSLSRFSPRSLSKSVLTRAVSARSHKSSRTSLLLLSRSSSHSSGFKPE